MKSVLTQVINRWFKKIFKIKCFSTYEIAYCNIKEGLGQTLLDF